MNETTQMLSHSHCNSEGTNAMISIKPEMFRLAVGVGESRPEALTDGIKNCSRHHLLSYDGDGFLTLMTTDNRMGVVSRLPVEGADSPWSATILAQPFDHLKNYVNGGAYELGARDATAVVLQKAPFQYPFRRGDPGVAFPLLTAPPANDAAATFEPIVLERALSLLVDTSKKREDEGGLDYCSIFADGLVAFAEDGILWKARGPILPFPVNLRRADAFRLWKWLKTLSAAGVTATMHIAGVEKDGRWSFVFWTQDRAHLLQVRTAPRSFPRRAVDRVAPGSLTNGL
jgi:hypothetical protein